MTGSPRGTSETEVQLSQTSPFWNGSPREVLTVNASHVRLDLAIPYWSIGIECLNSVWFETLLVHCVVMACYLANHVHVKLADFLGVMLSAAYFRTSQVDRNIVHRE